MQLAQIEGSVFQEKFQERRESRRGVSVDASVFEHDQQRGQRERERCALEQ